MEEKREIRIRLSTAISMFIIFILIVALGLMYYFGFVANKNDNTQKENISNTNVASNVENVITNVVNENKENIVTNNNDKNEIEENNTNTKSEEINSAEKTFSNAEIKKVMQMCLNLESAKTNGPQEALFILGLYKEENLQSYIDKEEPAKQIPFVKTSIKFTEFKNKMLKYMTEDCYKNQWKDIFKNENGYLCYNNIGATGVGYKVNSIKKVNNYYIANVTASSEGPDSKINVEFKIANTKCVVDFYEFK